MRTEFIIARIQISVKTSYELIVNGGYSLYRLNSKKANVKMLNESYEILMVEDSVFPRMEGRVLYQDELNLYILTKKGETLHYFRIPLTRSAAAWCETTGKQSLTIHYRQEAKEYFEKACGCFNAAAFENILYIYRKFLFHCSYVDVGGEAVLFSAHSGGGKTTHALLWEQCGLGEMINGDRAVIEKLDEHQIENSEKRDISCRYRYMVHGLPIAGSSKVFKNRSLPLRAIFMLEKASINEVVDLSIAKSFLQVVEQITIHMWDREFVDVATAFVTELVQNVPVKLLRCRPDEGAVYAVREALNAFK